MSTNESDDTAQMDRMVAARVESDLANDVETLSPVSLSEEIRAGLRLRRDILKNNSDVDQGDGPVTDGGTDRRSVMPTPDTSATFEDAIADISHDALDAGVSEDEAIDALRTVIAEIEEHRDVRDFGGVASDD